MPTTTQQLIDACVAGDLELVKRAVHLGADATANENTALQLAAANGHLGVVKWLIEESGQRVDATADDNWSLRKAVCHGYTGVARYLINESGQPVDITASGNEAVRLAAWNNHHEVVHYLIEESGQLNRMLRADTAWLRDLEASELASSINVIAVLGFGIDPSDFQTSSALVAHLETAPPNPMTRGLQQLLDQLHVSVAVVDRTPYFVSVACQHAAEAGLITTRAQLDMVLEKTNCSSATKRL